MRRLLPLLLLVAACSPARPVLPSPEVAPDTAFVLISPRDAAPTALHAAMRQMVAQCAGPEHLDVPLLLAIADSIVSLPSGRLAYGISAMADSVAIVVIEAPYIHHPTVFSHEMLHIGHLATETGLVMRQCTIYVGEPLKDRKVANPEELAGRGHVIRIRRRP